MTSLLASETWIAAVAADFTPTAVDTGNDETSFLVVAHLVRPRYNTDFSSTERFKRDTSKP